MNKTSLILVAALTAFPAAGRGDYAVVINESMPTYCNTTKYPVSFRFTVRTPGIGNRTIIADTRYTVVARAADSMMLRAETKDDTAKTLDEFESVSLARCPANCEPLGRHPLDG